MHDFVNVLIIGTLCMVALYYYVSFHHSFWCTIYSRVTSIPLLPEAGATLYTSFLTSRHFPTK